MPLKSTAPRAQMWSARHESKDRDRLVAFRTQLDQMTAAEVTWLPYGPDPVVMCPRTLYMGTICYRDVIEPYMPMRCLRQLGRRQCIPVAPIEPELALRPAKGKYEVRHAAGVLRSSWTAFPHGCCLHLDRFHKFVPPRLDTVSLDYMTWYFRCSHPRLLQMHTISREVARLPSRTATEEWVNLWMGVVGSLTLHRQHCHSDPAFIKACADAEELAWKWKKTLCSGFLQQEEVEEEEEEEDSDEEDSGEEDSDEEM